MKHCPVCRSEQLFGVNCNMCRHALSEGACPPPKSFANLAHLIQGEMAKVVGSGLKPAELWIGPKETRIFEDEFDRRLSLAENSRHPIIKGRLEGGMFRGMRVCLAEKDGIHVVGAKERPSWPKKIQEYVSQMTSADNAIKVEVLEHLNQMIATCLQQWRNETNPARPKPMPCQALRDLIQDNEPSWKTHPQSIWNRARRELAFIQGEEISEAKSWNPETNEWEL